MERLSENVTRETTEASVIACKSFINKKRKTEGTAETLCEKSVMKLKAARMMRKITAICAELIELMTKNRKDLKTELPGKRRRQKMKFLRSLVQALYYQHFLRKMDHTL